MSSWSCVTFDTGERAPEDVAAELERNVEDESGYTEGTEPYTYTFGGNLVWRRSRGRGIPDVEVPRALDIRMNDTTDSGTATLYERIDGRFVVADTHFSPEGDFGRQIFDYFLVHHDLPADTGSLVDYDLREDTDG